MGLCCCLTRALRIADGIDLKLGIPEFIRSLPELLQDCAHTLQLKQSNILDWIGDGYWLSRLDLMVAFLLLLGAAFVGRAFDAGYLKVTLLSASILMVFTTCMTSLGKAWWQLFLYTDLETILTFRAQGIGSGIAVGVYEIPVK